MKQYTTPEQTAKLIGLGVDGPKNERWILDVANESTPSIQNVVKRQDYSIGELIEMLPKTILHELWWGTEDEGVWGLRIYTEGTDYVWTVSYEREISPSLYCEARTELIDALYDMIVKLKEEGVI